MEVCGEMKLQLRFPQTQGFSLVIFFLSSLVFQFPSSSFSCLIALVFPAVFSVHPILDILPLMLKV